MLVVKKHQKLLLNLSEPDRVLAVMPTAKAVQYRGKTLVAVPHREDEVRVLRNLGFDPPAPISTYYDWPCQYPDGPFVHQRVTSEHLTTNPRDFCLNGMGSGKTLSVLWAFDYLRKLGKVKRMLVLSPLSTLERAWGDEIFRHFYDMSFAVLHGTREKRHKLLASDFDVYIINHDGIKADDTVSLLREREGLDLIVIDEIASFRNSATARWKALNAIVNPKYEVGGKMVVKPKPWVWGLTGTPTPNDPTDAWAQCRLISPSRVPPYFGKFRDQVMKPVTRFKWAARDSALDIVKGCMQPAIRFSREECVDLPPTMFVTRQAELTPDQKKAYNEMLKTFKIEHASGPITALNEAVKVDKLIQICCGVAYGKDGLEVAYPATSRIELVKEIIDEAGSKVLVFVPRTAALKVIADELGEDYSVEIVHGETPRTERDRIFQDFQKSENPRVIVANPGTLSHGLTLTAANTIIWFAPINSNETFQQANARIVRPGQKLNTLIVHIEATDLERKMYARLQGRQKMQGLLLDLIKEMK
jgi:SNF2 family DNA or RNA helicase